MIKKFFIKIAAATFTCRFTSLIKTGLTDIEPYVFKAFKVNTYSCQNYKTAIFTRKILEKMYSKTNKRSNKVKISTDKDYLRLQFPSSLSKLLYGKRQFF